MALHRNIRQNMVAIYLRKKIQERPKTKVIIPNAVEI